jgi:hypothetical protein
MSALHHDDFDFEPVRGLPAHLPEGERMLWQGAPDWLRLSIDAFYLRVVAIYFALLIAWRFATALYDGLGVAAALLHAAWMLPVALAGVAILAGLGWLYARGTVYTLTSRRLIIRSGVALPVTLNIPLARIDTAAAAQLAGNTGNISFTIARPERIAYLLLWPHARPFALRNPRPMLRAIPDLDHVARTVAGALAAEAGTRAGTSAPRLRLVKEAADAGQTPLSASPLAASKG